jgi:hypothetical protein
METPLPLKFVETTRTARQVYRAVSRSQPGFYYVSQRPDGQWIAEHTIGGPIGGSFASKELAMRACSVQDARGAPSA